MLRFVRRVGGVRAGSASFTYAPSAEAFRLVSFAAGSGIPRARVVVEPGTSFVDHTVAVNEIYVQLMAARRAGGIELLEHEAEPDCWRRFLGPIGNAISLRPDAFVALGVGELEQRSFVEVDRGTEGTTALRRKLLSYVDYWRSGVEQQRHGVFPRVVWQVGHPRRATVLAALIQELPAEARRLFVVGEVADLLAQLRGDDRGSGRPAMSGTVVTAPVLVLAVAHGRRCTAIGGAGGWCRPTPAGCYRCYQRPRSTPS